MPKLKELVIDEGMLFTNAFVTTPICCPSRSSILTGKYIHNHGAHNNSVEGNCAGTDWLVLYRQFAFSNNVSIADKRCIGSCASL